MITFFFSIWVAIIFTFFILLNIKLATKKQTYIVFGIIVVSLSIIAFNFDSNAGFDVERHYLILDNMRQMNISLYDSIFKYTGGYNGLITYNIICYIVSKLPNNHFLPLIITAITYTIVFYILLDWYSDSNNKKYNYVYALFVNLTLTPFYFVVTGVRNGVAASIMALAAYLYLYKGKKITMAICLMLISITIHSSTLIAVPFVFLAKQKMSIRNIGYILFISIFLHRIAYLFTNLDNLFLKNIGNSYLLYTSKHQFKSAEYFLYADLLLIIITIVFFALKINQTDKISHFENITKKDRVKNFVIYFMIYILGNIGNYDLILRPAYILGPLAPIIVEVLLSKNSKIITMIIKLLILFICGYTVSRYLFYFISNAYFL